MRELPDDVAPHAHLRCSCFGGFPSHHVRILGNKGVLLHHIHNSTSHTVIEVDARNIIQMFQGVKVAKTCLVVLILDIISLAFSFDSVLFSFLL